MFSEADKLPVTCETMSMIACLAEKSSDIIYYLKIRPGSAGLSLQLRYVSPSIENITGLNRESCVENPAILARFIHADDLGKLRHLRNDLDLWTRPLEVRWVSYCGTTIWLEHRHVVLKDPEDGSFEILGIARDVTERKLREESLLNLVYRDTLTGLHNRTYLEKRIAELQADPAAFPLAVISADIDSLKEINDSLGHNQGDRLLVQYAQILKKALPPNAEIARTGGDEFTAVITQITTKRAQELCERIQQAIALANFSGHEPKLSISLGYAVCESPESDILKALRDADSMMYESKLRQLSSSRHGTVRVLLAALQAKDAETEKHAQRVAKWCIRLAEAVGLGPQETNQLMLLAQVHDIGKLGVPDYLLTKRGTLTEAEREKLREHCVIGYRIASASKELSPIAKLILHHHEWWDGTGYPCRLAGESIPVVCRILAIVDAFDAMVGARPYRKPITVAEALLELVKYSGRQFDPHLVERFVDVIAGDEENDWS